MLRTALLASVAALAIPAGAQAATFFQFNIGWAAGGIDYALFGTTAPGQNTAGTFDVTSTTNFSINGAPVGFSLYAGNIGNTAGDGVLQRGSAVNVSIADDGMGGFTASLANTIAWFTGAGWDFGQADQQGKRGYNFSPNLFYVHTAGWEWNEEFIPRNAGSGLVEIYGNTPPPASAFGINNITGTATVIPVPAAMPLLLSGLFGLGVIGWRRRRAA